MAKNATSATRRLVGINHAAEYADVHPITIRRWVSAGRVPAYRAGPRLLKIDLNELDAMLQSLMSQLASSQYANASQMMKPPTTGAVVSSAV